MRERGLKCWSPITGEQTLCRSREGAWIEIITINQFREAFQSRSREGAWIEIDQYSNYKLVRRVAPVRERGLKYQY